MKKSLSTLVASMAAEGKTTEEIAAAVARQCDKARIEQKKRELEKKLFGVRKFSKEQRETLMFLYCKEHLKDFRVFVDGKFPAGSAQ